MENFIKEKEIQRGSFGTVYIVTRKADMRQYALKQTSLAQLDDAEKTRVLNEVRILAAVKHPNIIRFKECFYDRSEDTLNVVTEYAEKGDLSKKIKSYQLQRHMHIPENELWRILTDVSKGLEYLHKHRIVHRDIKPANILQTPTGYKIVDLNASKIVESRGNLLQTQIGTPYYACPQAWKEQAYSEKCDVWSLGVVMYELSALRLPFPAKAKSELNNRIQNYDPNPLSDIYSEFYRKLVMQMLNKDEDERPSIWTVLEHCSLYQKVKKQTEEVVQPSLIDTIVFEENEISWKNSLPPPKFSPAKPPKQAHCFKKIMSNCQSTPFNDIQNYIYKIKNFENEPSLDIQKRAIALNSRQNNPIKGRFGQQPQMTPPSITRKNSGNHPKELAPVIVNKDKSFSMRGNTPQKFPAINSDRSRVNLR